MCFAQPELNHSYIDAKLILSTTLVDNMLVSFGVSFVCLMFEG